MLAEHLEGRRDHALRLWVLLMFELWHRRYLDRGSAIPFHAQPIPQKEKVGQPAGGVLDMSSYGVVAPALLKRKRCCPAVPSPSPSS